MKHDDTKGKTRKTGSALLVNKIKNLSIIDIDINKDLNDEDKAKVRKDIFEKLTEDDIIIYNHKP